VFHSSLVREKMCEWNCGPAATWNERTRNGDELHDLDKEADPDEIEISVPHDDSKFFLDTACLIPKPSSPRGSIHEDDAQIEFGPCGPKQVILLTESRRRLGED